MDLWSGYSFYLVSPCSLDVFSDWTDKLQLCQLQNYFGPFLVSFYPSFSYICMLLSHLYQSSWRSFCSTPWCSRPEGKKTDKYNVSCHIWIVLNFPAANGFLATIQPSHQLRFSHFNGGVCFFCPQLANKSYDLRHTDARI